MCNKTPVKSSPILLPHDIFRITQLACLTDHVGTIFNSLNPGSGHICLYLSLNTTLMKLNTSKIINEAIADKKTNWTTSFREGEIYPKELNSHNFMTSELLSEHPHGSLSCQIPQKHNNMTTNFAISYTWRTRISKHHFSGYSVMLLSFLNLFCLNTPKSNIFLSLIRFNKIFKTYKYIRFNWWFELWSNMI